MSGRLVDVVTARGSSRSLDAACGALGTDELRAAAAELERFRRAAPSLYERVRALLCLHAVHRYHLPGRAGVPAVGRVPREAGRHLLERRFEDAIDALLAEVEGSGPSGAASSGLAAAYRALGFQTLADQVKRSVRAAEDDGWTFTLGDPRAHPLRLAPALLEPDAVLRERTPVRMDLCHSAWSDIFFLAMDRPEGARVVNVSVDLAVRGNDTSPRPPIETSLRALGRPVLRLASVDLGAEAELETVGDVFDFARDHLGLLKAAVVASGIVPPGLEGSGAPLAPLLERVVGPGRGLELVSHVRGIPRGSRLAVSTSLLASLIALVMRATGRTRDLEGPLADDERRRVVARALLGEWLGGSGGGWQDSGGLWPGFKRIEGALARPGDPEHGASRGRLLPEHRVLGPEAVPPRARTALMESLVLVHGGLAQDVGPILEMVTERHLLGDEEAARARDRAGELYDRVLAALAAGDTRALGAATTETFLGPVRTIVPWASNVFAERVLERARTRLGDDLHGFLMLGGMAGGGMGFLVHPERRDAAREDLAGILLATKRELERAIPFAMDPVVYDVAVNEVGTTAELSVERGVPARARDTAPARAADRALAARLTERGFDREEHERHRADLLAGRVGLARNRLPESTSIEDARPGDVVELGAAGADERRLGEEALARGEVAVVVLAGGTGTRWSGGAGTVKALHPFARLAGRHRSFLDVHLAKARRTARLAGAAPPVVVTTSYATHAALSDALPQLPGEVPVLLSPGRRVGLRLVPTERDLRFAWEATRRQVLDERAERVRASLQEAWIAWAREQGEASDYADNELELCLHPVGHGYEVPNLLSSGALAELLELRPGLSTLLVHNVDTLGADLDPTALGLHLSGGAALSFEVVPRWIDDRGGGLARVDGRLRLVESLALPREDDELGLSHYSSMTSWVDVDGLLALFGLGRGDLTDAPRVARAARDTARRLPAYVTLKEVVRRFGAGHADVLPVAQYERLWGDVSALPEARCAYRAVPRRRGQQLKEPAQLDGWLRDGSAAHVEGLGDWD